MNLLSILMKALLGKSTLTALAKKTGLNASQLKKLIPLALPLLLKYLTGNASNQSGALSLLGALGQHTSKKPLPEQIAEADQTDGGKILLHILGKDNDQAVQSLASQSGLSGTQVNTALGSLAPALLSTPELRHRLRRKRRQGGSLRRAGSQRCGGPSGRRQGFRQSLRSAEQPDRRRQGQQEEREGQQPQRQRPAVRPAELQGLICPKSFDEKRSPAPAGERFSCLSYYNIGESDERVFC